MKYRNAKYIDGNRIDCEINHPQFGWIPYTLDPADTDNTIDNNKLLSEMKAKGNVADYVQPSQKEVEEEAARSVRDFRDYKLRSEVDPIVSNPLRWESMTTTDRNALASYRQALLDVTDQDGFPMNVVWPEKPFG